MRKKSALPSASLSNGGLALPPQRPATADPFVPEAQSRVMAPTRREVLFKGGIGGPRPVLDKDMVQHLVKLAAEMLGLPEVAVQALLKPTVRNQHLHSPVPEAFQLPVPGVVGMTSPLLPEGSFQLEKYIITVPASKRVTGVVSASCSLFGEASSKRGV
jgi:hypothetical protein